MCKTVKSQKPEFGVLDVSEKTEREMVLVAWRGCFLKTAKEVLESPSNQRQCLIGRAESTSQTVSDLFTPYILWYSYMYGFKS